MGGGKHERKMKTGGRGFRGYWIPCGLKNLTQNTHVLGNVCRRAVLLIMTFKVWSISRSLRNPYNTCNHVQFSIWKSRLFTRTTLIEIYGKNGWENRYSEDRWELADLFCYTISLWFFDTVGILLPGSGWRGSLLSLQSDHFSWGKAKAHKSNVC